jgi:hypothetical protein
MKTIDELIQQLEETADRQLKLITDFAKIINGLLPENQTGDDLTYKVYKDSTGAIISQPQVVLQDKKTGTQYHATFRNGVFYDDFTDGEPSFEMDYEYALHNYWIVEKGDRIECHHDCVLNKHDGCTINPQLTLGTGQQVCQSKIVKP